MDGRHTTLNANRSCTRENAYCRWKPLPLPLEKMTASLDTPFSFSGASERCGLLFLMSLNDAGGTMREGTHPYITRKKKRTSSVLGQPKPESLKPRWALHLPHPQPSKNILAEVLRRPMAPLKHMFATPSHGSNKTHPCYPSPWSH